MTPIDWTLLTISGANKPLQPVQLQKVLFLFGRKVSDDFVPISEKYDFRAYDYGPFSAAVYSDAETLEREGLVVIRRPPEARFKEYSVTKTGADRARAIAGDVNSAVYEYLKALVEYTQSVSFNELVASVYREFPEMKANSVFKENP